MVDSKRVFQAFNSITEKYPEIPQKERLRIAYNWNSVRKEDLGKPFDCKEFWGFVKDNTLEDLQVEIDFYEYLLEPFKRYDFVVKDVIRDSVAAREAKRQKQMGYKAGAAKRVKHPEYGGKTLTQALGEEVFEVGDPEQFIKIGEELLPLPILSGAGQKVRGRPSMGNRPMTQVMSSNVMGRAVRGNNLYVRFHGTPDKVYKYSMPSPEAAMEAFEDITLESPGRWVWENLRGKQMGPVFGKPSRQTPGGTSASIRPYDKLTYGRVKNILQEVPNFEELATKLRKYKMEVKKDDPTSAEPFTQQELLEFQNKAREELAKRKKLAKELETLFKEKGIHRIPIEQLPKLDMINMKVEDTEEGRWVTIKGTHVFIKKGQSPEEALKETIGKGEKKKEETEECALCNLYKSSSVMKVIKWRGKWETVCNKCRRSLGEDMLEDFDLSTPLPELFKTYKKWLDLRNNASTPEKRVEFDKTCKGIKKLIEQKQKKEENNFNKIRDYITDTLIDLGSEESKEWNQAVIEDSNKITTWEGLRDFFVDTITDITTEESEEWRKTVIEDSKNYTTPKEIVNFIRDVVSDVHTEGKEWFSSFESGLKEIKGKGKGWHGESERHSKAKKTGKADLIEDMKLNLNPAEARLILELLEEIDEEDPYYREVASRIGVKIGHQSYGKFPEVEEMAIEVLQKGKGRGWHGESERHSKAAKTGKADFREEYNWFIETRNKSNDTWIRSLHKSKGLYGNTYILRISSRDLRDLLQIYEGEKTEANDYIFFVSTNEFLKALEKSEYKKVYIEDGKISEAENGQGKGWFGEPERHSQAAKKGKKQDFEPLIEDLAYQGHQGVWRTSETGKHYFIRQGESPKEAWKRQKETTTKKEVYQTLYKKKLKEKPSMEKVVEKEKLKERIRKTKGSGVRLRKQLDELKGKKEVPTKNKPKRISKEEKEPKHTLAQQLNILQKKLKTATPEEVKRIKQLVEKIKKRIKIAKKFDFIDIIIEQIENKNLAFDLISKSIPKIEGLKLVADSFGQIRHGYKKKIHRGRKKVKIEKVNIEEPSEEKEEITPPKKKKEDKADFIHSFPIHIENDFVPFTRVNDSVLGGYIVRDGPYLYGDQIKYKEWDNIQDVYGNTDYMIAYGSRDKDSHTEKEDRMIGYFDNFVMVPKGIKGPYPVIGKDGKKTYVDNNYNRVATNLHTDKDILDLSDLEKDELFELPVSASYDDLGRSNIQQISRLHHGAVSLNKNEMDRCSTLNGSSCNMSLIEDFIEVSTTIKTKGSDIEIDPTKNELDTSDINQNLTKNEIEIPIKN